MKCPQCNDDMTKEQEPFQPNGGDLLIGESFGRDIETYDTVTSVYVCGTCTLHVYVGSL